MPQWTDLVELPLELPLSFRIIIPYKINKISLDGFPALITEL